MQKLGAGWLLRLVLLSRARGGWGSCWKRAFCRVNFRSRRRRRRRCVTPTQGLASSTLRSRESRLPPDRRITYFATKAIQKHAQRYLYVHLYTFKSGYVIVRVRSRRRRGGRDLCRGLKLFRFFFPPSGRAHVIYNIILFSPPPQSRAIKRARPLRTICDPNVARRKINARVRLRAPSSRDPRSRHTYILLSWGWKRSRSISVERKYQYAASWNLHTIRIIYLATIAAVSRRVLENNKIIHIILLLLNAHGETGTLGRAYRHATDSIASIVSDE